MAWPATLTVLLLAAVLAVLRGAQAHLRGVASVMALLCASRPEGRGPALGRGSPLGRCLNSPMHWLVGLACRVGRGSPWRRGKAEQEQTSLGKYIPGMWAVR